MSNVIVKQFIIVDYRDFQEEFHLQKLKFIIRLCP